ncbi:unnamed protein product [Orchesella dallaii]|uniref:Peptidase C45 hydrolase domain-containing protein n=1 Tax=Orchesella dallaii TaxID=48710 RepID=A0ABP1QH76_9HEXA
MKPVKSLKPKRESLPVLHCRGSYYDVGFSIGKTFRGIIQDSLAENQFYNEVVLKAGSTPAGKILVQNCLDVCMAKYPNYVSEIRGTADGAQISFDELFMLNMDSILSTIDEVRNHNEVSKVGGTGCTTIICNKNDVILGHTEDALAEIKNHIYIVSAEIVDEEGELLEKFTTLCYPGVLMGYTMGYNSNGMIYSVNTIFPTVHTSGTPRSFVARALLSTSNLDELVRLLEDEGNGVADGFSINVYFYQKNGIINGNETSTDMDALYNIEVAPPLANTFPMKSSVNVMKVGPGQIYEHCNRFLRISTKEINQTALKYSDRRSDTIKSHHKPPSNQKDVEEILSNQTDYNYPIYNEEKEDNGKYDMSFIKTVAVGKYLLNSYTPCLCISFIDIRPLSFCLWIIWNLPYTDL